MLTIFCSPKPFINEADWNQRNALRSWKAIHPDVEIFIFCAPSGAAEAAAGINAVLVPEIECSPSGAPSFNAMEKYVSNYGRHDLQVYVNCDILLNTTFLKAMLASHNRFGRFLMIGERLDLAKGAIVDIRNPGYLDYLAPMTKKGQLTSHGPTGVDYFGFIRGMWEDLPQVYMGRALCDQALLHYCLNQKIPIIDSTQSVMAVHQYHDYAHVKGGKQEVFRGADWALMTREHQLGHSLPTITDADWRFGENGNIIPGRRRKLRHWELVLRYRYKLNNIAIIFRALQYLGGKKNLQPKNIPINDILVSWGRFLNASSNFPSTILKH
jgi:hypothetical protein